MSLSSWEKKTRDHKQVDFSAELFSSALHPDPGSSEKIGHQIRRHAVPHVAKHTAETSGGCQVSKEVGPSETQHSIEAVCSSEEHFVRALARVQDKHVCDTSSSDR